MDQIIPIVQLAKEKSVALRFIELMPIGYGSKFTPIKNKEIRRILEDEFGEMESVTANLGNGPAEYYKLGDFKGVIGFISAVSNKFCSTCNRIRITSNGFLKTCLHYNKGIHLKEYLKQDIDVDELASIIEGQISEKPQKHRFNEEKINNVEDKSMFQIGG